MNEARKRIRIITSCTGVKARTSPASRAAVHKRLGVATSGPLVAAADLYLGQQHIRLMRGIAALRASGAAVDIDLWILSAGYGLVPAHALLTHYECTFAEMTRSEAHERARALQIPQHIRGLLSREADLALVLLGDDYIAACEFGSDVELGAPTLVVCGRGTSVRLPPIAELHTVELGVAETRRFSCGLVGLKGEVARRLLLAVADDLAFVDAATQPRLLDRLAERPVLERERTPALF